MPIPMPMFEPDPPLSLAELFMLLGYHFGYGNHLALPGTTFIAFDSATVQHKLQVNSFIELSSDSTPDNISMQLSDRGTKMVQSLIGLPVPVLRGYWAMPDDPLMVGVPHG